MPRQFPATVHPSAAGVQLAFTAPDAAGDAVRPNAVLLINNAGGTARTVTLITGGLAGDLAIADPTVTVPAGQIVAIGPFSQVFPQISGADTGYVYVNYDAITSVTRAVLGGIA